LTHRGLKPTATLTASLREAVRGRPEKNTELRPSARGFQKIR